MARKRDRGLRRRAGVWYCYYQGPGGEQVEEAGGTKDEARALRARRLLEMEAGTWVAPATRRQKKQETVSMFADRWLERRGKGRRPPKTLADDRSRLRDHIRPVIGDVVLEQLAEADLLRLLEVLQTKRSDATGEPLSPNTIHNVWGTTTKLLADAERDFARRGVAWTSPVRVMDDADKPRRVRRPRGYYRRDEVESLIGDERVPLDRRVLWALLFLTGMRHDEAAELRWVDIDWRETPLPRITLARQVSGHLKEDKHGVGLTRLVPVHGLLRELLEEWRGRGWVTYYGRHPRDEDLVSPATRSAKAHRPVRTTLKQIRRDAELVGAKPRTTHETRSTFLTLASEDSPHLEHVIKLITHQPPSGPASETYMRQRWLAKCEAIAAFAIRLDRHAEVVPMVASGSAIPGEIPGTGSQTQETPCKTGGFWRSGRDSNPRPPA